MYADFLPLLVALELSHTVDCLQNIWLLKDCRVTRLRTCRLSMWASSLSETHWETAESPF